MYWAKVDRKITYDISPLATCWEGYSELTVSISLLIPISLYCWKLILALGWNIFLKCSKLHLQPLFSPQCMVHFSSPFQILNCFLICLNHLEQRLGLWKELGVSDVTIITCSYNLILSRLLLNKIFVLSRPCLVYSGHELPLLPYSEVSFSRLFSQVLFPLII